MADYWFDNWLTENRVTDPASLCRVLRNRRNLDALVESAPAPAVPVQFERPTIVELTGGKGIDLTGELGCRHLDCLKREVDSLFRHAWHYFDTIILPDQALNQILRFNDHRDAEQLIKTLSKFVVLLRFMDVMGGRRLVRFETRIPSCRQHLEQHALDAGIDQALSNIDPLVEELAISSTISWEKTIIEDHEHLDFRLDHAWFEHSEWGNFCSHSAALPTDELDIRNAVSLDVVQEYLAGLSADALAARHSRAPLGATIPFYKRLLSVTPKQGVQDVAFELALPICPDIPLPDLIEFRANEKEAFERFQYAIRIAITEKMKNASGVSAEKLAQEIKQDVIDPELRHIRDRLSASRALASKTAATGLALGTAAASIGLLAPLANPVGAGLAVGGAITLGASAVKKAMEDHFSTKREIALSDMYFLWKAHSHPSLTPEALA